MDFTLSYLDPGAGSMLVQLVAGGVAALAVTARLYWRRVKSRLGFGRRDED